jgi:predicted Zn-dependent protease
VDPNLSNCAFQPFDAEGSQGKLTQLFNKGVLTNFMVDLQSAKHLSIPANAHARLDEYDKNPKVRMSSIFLSPEESWEQNISLNDNELEKIKDTLFSNKDLGRSENILYLSDWSGGIADWRNLTFQITVPLAYYFSRNKTTKIYSDINFSGSSLSLLNNYSAAFGKLIVNSYGICLKNKDRIKTSDGGPQITVFKNSKEYNVN